MSQYNSKTIFSTVENANVCAIVSTVCCAYGGTYIGTISGANACANVSTVCCAYGGTYFYFSSFECKLQAYDVWSHYRSF